MLWKRLAVLVAAAVIVLSMFAASAVAFAQGAIEGQGFDEGVGGSDPNPGASEGSSSPLGTPPQGKAGASIRDPEANEHDPSGTGTGFGYRVDARD